jgi:hypothetical protein
VDESGEIVMGGEDTIKFGGDDNLVVTQTEGEPRRLSILHRGGCLSSPSDLLQILKI